MDDAAACRKRAKQAREIVEKIKNPLDKAAWLRVDDDWIKFAEIAEARTAIRAPSMVNGPKWTPLEDEHLLALKATGLQNVQIAGQFTRTEWTVVAQFVLLKKQMITE
jgi:hypothetical protein